MTDVLCESNFVIFAAKHYDNPTCVDTEEFVEDLRRFKYIKKLLTRYMATGELKERLILNHTIVLANVFAPEPLVRMMSLKMEKQLHLIKPFLLLLNVYLPFARDIRAQGRIVDLDGVIMDQKVVEILRKISRGT